MKKHSNLLKTCLLFMLIATFVSGCGKKTPEIAQQFNNDLKTANYEDILNMMNLPENTICNEKDLEEYISTTELKPFIKADDIKVEKIKSGKRAIVENISINGSSLVTIAFNLKEDGSYSMDSLGGMFHTVKFCAPKNAKITVNGTKLDNKLATEDRYANTYDADAYEINVPKTDLKIKMETDIGTFNHTIKYDEDEKYDYPTKELFTDIKLDSETQRDIKNDVMDDIEGAINAINLGKTSDTSFEDYFTDDNSSEYVEQLKNILSGNANFKISDLQPDAENDDNCIYASDEICWKAKVETSYGDNDKSRVYATFELRKEDGSYKIKSTDLFGNMFLTNPFSFDW